MSMSLLLHLADTQASSEYRTRMGCASGKLGQLAPFKLTLLHVCSLFLRAQSCTGACPHSGASFMETLSCDPGLTGAALLGRHNIHTHATGCRPKGQYIAADFWITREDSLHKGCNNLLRCHRSYIVISQDTSKCL